MGRHGDAGLLEATGFARPSRLPTEKGATSSRAQEVDRFSRRSSGCDPWFALDFVTSVDARVVSMDSRVVSVDRRGSWG
jgi:hypothetical protein